MWIVLKGLGFNSFVGVGRVVRVHLDIRRCAGDPISSLGVFLRLSRPNITLEPSFFDFSRSCLTCLTAFSARPLDFG